MKQIKLLCAVLALVIAAVVGGCIGDKPLVDTSAQGAVYKMAIKLPFEVKESPKAMPIDTKTSIYVESAESLMERPTGYDIHLAEFVMNKFNTGNIELEYGAAGSEKNKEFHQNFAKVITDSYIKSLTTAAKMEDVTQTSESATIAERQATITTVQCKMRGEPEVLKVIYIDDAEESWLVALAYPAEKEDGIGKKITDEIIPAITLTK